MQALIYSPILSHPPTAGNRQAVYHIGKFMQSAGYIVHFVYYTLEGLSADQYKKMRSEWDYFDVLVKSQSQPGPRTLGDVFAKDDWYEERVGEFLQWKIHEFDIRLILFHYIFQSKALELLPRYVRKIIHTHDKMSNRHKLFDLHGLEREFFYTTPDEEGAALKRADELIAVQREEAQFFEKISGRPVHVLRQYFPPRLEISKPSLRLRRIGYFGSDNLINVESIIQFVSALKRERLLDMGISLTIAGGVCDALRDVNGDGIDLMGRVDRPEQFYETVDLVVNPMLLGTGLKIKTVEALSFGAPVLSTRAGMSGIEARHPYHLCETVDEVVQCVRFILNQPEALTGLRNETRRLFSEYYADTVSQLGKIFPPVHAEGGASLRDGELTILAFDFRGPGWYATEEDSQGLPFRWLGPKQTAEIHIDLQRGAPLLCALDVIHSIRADIFQSAEIEVDGLSLPVIREDWAPTAGRLKFTMPSAIKNGKSITRIKISLSTTVRPRDLDGSSPDTRSLGIAVRQLRLIQQSRAQS